MILAEEAVYGPLYRTPQRIFGIGLNYVDHAGDLGESAPVGFPGSFYKPASCIIGPMDEIRIPELEEAKKTTAEAELGIILGKDCKCIDEEDWEKYIAGYTAILDMTEESILRQNPRFLTIAKGFDTFFSFGPQLVTPDEVPDVLKLNVQTVHNGRVHAGNDVSNMTHKPARLVSLVSRLQGWKAGEILSTGTPRAVHIEDGDTAECRISGPDGFMMEPLINPVVDMKKRRGNMELGLKDKTAIVSASSSGLGKAIAMELCREGARVMLFSPFEEQLKERRPKSKKRQVTGRNMWPEISQRRRILKGW